MVTKRYRVEAANTAGKSYKLSFINEGSAEDWAICSVNGLRWANKLAPAGEAINVAALAGYPLERVQITDIETLESTVLNATELVGLSPVRQKESPVGSVYVLRGPAGIKIGYTGQHPEVRRRALSHAAGEDLVLIAHWPGSRSDEGVLHRQFVSYRRPFGEWFLEEGDVAEWVTSLT